MAKNSNSNNSFNQAIKSYLDKRAGEDALFAPKYANSKKSVDECCSYIIGEAKKRGNAVAMTDDEVFGLAIHYYDEDNIKINKLPANCRDSVGTTVELSEEDKKKAREAVVKRLTDEQHALLKKKANKKKVNDDVRQMSLF